MDPSHRPSRACRPLGSTPITRLIMLRRKLNSSRRPPCGQALSRPMIHLGATATKPINHISLLLVSNPISRHSLLRSSQASNNGATDNHYGVTDLRLVAHNRSSPNSKRATRRISIWASTSLFSGLPDNRLFKYMMHNLFRSKFFSTLLNSNVCQRFMRTHLQMDWFILRSKSPAMVLWSMRDTCISNACAIMSKKDICIMLRRYYNMLIFSKRATSHLMPHRAPQGTEGEEGGKVQREKQSPSYSSEVERIWIRRVCKE